MQVKLSIILIIVAVTLILLTTIVLRRGRIPEKYALLWYAMALIILLVSLMPNVFSKIANSLGFYPMSSFIICIFIGLLIILVMALTIMLAGQKKKTTMLIQEVSILKKEIKK